MQKCSGSLEADSNIQPKRPILYIKDVEAVLVLKGQVGTSGNLCHTRDSRLDGQKPTMIFRVTLHFALLVRSRTHKTHIAAQNIEKLRQLVKRKTLNKGANLHLARVVFDLVKNTSSATVLFFDEFFLKGKRFFELWVFFRNAVLPL